MPDGVVLTRLGAVAEDALAGLLATPKTLPPKLFYDEAGCALFARITELPEYYVTRTERALLMSRAADIVDNLPAAPLALVEYGASSEDKAAILFDALVAAGRPAAAYVPIDVATAALAAVRARMRLSQPGIAVLPVAADFQQALRLPDAIGGLRRLGFFPGSTIGNLDPAAAQAFLGTARATLGRGAGFLVGVDLRKDASLLVPAYDDSAGVTAAFNRNLLARLNREAGADFDLRAFRHRAIWNDAESRIEMHLVSRRAQTVRVAGHAIMFAQGETIHTENSYKHSVAGFRALAVGAGWRVAKTWMDGAELFSVHLLQGE